MPWQYSQRTGQLIRNDQVAGTGYSGRGAGRNNPNLEQARNIGPVPGDVTELGALMRMQRKGP